MTSQVARPHYYGLNYITPSRFASYAYQLMEIMVLKPNNVLEIGIGNGLVSCMLRKAKIQVTTVDFDKAICPDIVASVTDMSVRGGSFDVVVCFEVLEHLPYNHFNRAVSEIFRISNSYAILSLPDVQRAYRIDAQFPKIGEIKKLIHIPRLRKLIHIFDGEHYWEIGKANYPLSKIIKDIQIAGFRIEKTYRAFENPYHRFFILEKPKQDNI